MEKLPGFIVGLGNPGPSYEHTRHNIGRLFVEALLEEAHPPAPCLHLSSYMNQSGPALKRALAKKNTQAPDVLVVFDDFMLPFGSVRLRPSGSAGGHNGLKSVIETFGTQDIPRLRFGIGPVPPSEDPADFVLEKFRKEELQKLPEIFKTVRDGLDIFFKEGFQKGMSTLNTTK